ncbi:MFS transporter [Streptomonospora nanhaiensis]|uniref:MFS transporter n=1 Tax=Streptomonospora nanhaiensis TaxID=1323731 RepID=UPI001C384CCC|nr:MFS transporter [Streptomonospora nanhaiensis]MBV2367033.1 MFS transporter [Streptomonospora nanhaiensis]MBX9386651.1 MFS transporter [Streptomonospora nanhaiensis]
MLGSYLALLRRAHVPSALAINIVGRLPHGMVALALTLLFRDEGVPFGTVGVLVAVYGVGTAVGGPVLGRLVDFYGQPVVLVVSGAVAAGTLMWLALAPDAPLAAALALTALAGASTPPLEPCLRSIWPDLVPDEQERETAYSLDAALQEVIFVTAPLLVVAVAAPFAPVGAVVATAVITVTGAAAFAALRPVRRWRPVPRRTNWLGPLMSARVRRVVVCFVFVGTALGALAVGAVAYSEAAGARDVSGLLLSANGLGALVGGLLYGALPMPFSPTVRFRLLLGGLALGYLPLLLMPGTALMAVFAALSGLFLAPALACTFLLLGRAAPAGTATEAFAWLISMFVCGNALGSAAAGAAVELAGPVAPFVVAAAATLLAALLSLRVREPRGTGTLSPTSGTGAAPSTPG